MCQKQEQLSKSLTAEELKKIAEVVERMETELKEFERLRELAEKAEDN